MKSLNLSNLGLAVLAGLVLGVSAAALAVSLGLALPASPPSLLLAIFGLGVIALLLTLPLISYRRKLQRYLAGQLKVRPERVNPIYAYRVLVWARASALAGAGFLGWHLGQLIYLSSFALPTATLAQSAGLGASASSALVVSAWLAEHNCRVTDGDGSSGGRGGAAGGGSTDEAAA